MGWKSVSVLTFYVDGGSSGGGSLYGYGRHVTRGNGNYCYAGNDGDQYGGGSGDDSPSGDTAADLLV